MHLHLVPDHLITGVRLGALTADGSADINGPAAAIAISIMLGLVILIGGALAAFVEMRKTKLQTGQEEAMRQLVGRYEQLAANTLDAQQRTAADVAELRARTASIEQILRTVE
jgi:flagellar basal body-associated protein FliL